ncbi:MAG TPA: hypothetical protein VGG45_10270 [Terracidiphilus sp.]
MMLSLRPHVVFAIALSPSLGHDLRGQFMFCAADFIEQFVERFGRQFLSYRQWAKGVNEEQPHTKNLGEHGVGRSIRLGSAPQFSKDELADEFARRHTSIPAVPFERCGFFLIQLGSGCLEPEPCALRCIFGKLFVAEERHRFPSKARALQSARAAVSLLFSVKIPERR